MTSLFLHDRLAIGRCKMYQLSCVQMWQMYTKCIKELFKKALYK